MPVPVRLSDAEERRQQITLEIQGIQAQLGDKQRTDESGRRLDATEYWTWKKRAQHALNQKLDELRTLKNWIRDHRGTTPDHPAIPSDDVVEHLRNLLGVLRNLQDEEVELDSHELNKIEAAQHTLDRLDANPKRVIHVQGQIQEPSRPTPADSSGQ